MDMSYRGNSIKPATKVGQQDSYACSASKSLAG